ncbi:venom allergen 5.02-like [Schistocerca gregaria]|uniref:venom allergen 5.02-like n=1 Tax=Schistocerca gregaria TaxID=7010 RepID=UPI00211E4613|nr:venom allergen 5.02-like [Schistocerca gregaria]
MYLAVNCRSLLLCAAVVLLLPCSGDGFSAAGYSGATCRGSSLLQSGGLSCDVKKSILDAHNKYRQSIALGYVAGQPGAARMLEMVWDEELASIAQRWADQCTMGHDHNRDVSRFPVGQNVAATWTTRRQVSLEPDFARQIAAWYGEVAAYRYQDGSLGAATGHYTQLVWGDTYLVGCGYSFFYDRSRGYTKLYVCNYGPGGNVVGAAPYEKGSPSCSSQGISPSKRYPGLCEVRGYSQLGSQCSYSTFGGFSAFWG